MGRLFRLGGREGLSEEVALAVPGALTCLMGGLEGSHLFVENF